MSYARNYRPRAKSVIIIKHPFHLLMHEGKLSRGQLQAWALNRYYYQSTHSNQRFDHPLTWSEDPVFRRAWRKRVVDHDGDATE